MSEGMEYSIVENFINCKLWNLIPVLINHNENIIIYVANLPILII